MAIDTTSHPARRSDSAILGFSELSRTYLRRGCHFEICVELPLPPDRLLNLSRLDPIGVRYELGRVPSIVEAPDRAGRNAGAVNTWLPELDLRLQTDAF